jgi:hypothetical protein
MTEQEFFAKAMLACAQGLLSSIGNGLAEEYHDPHGTLAAMARDYAEELTTRYVIASAKLKTESAKAL